MLSVGEAARILGISKWTVRRYIRDGKIPPVRIGRRVLLADDELDRFVSACQQPVEVEQSLVQAEVGNAKA